MTMRFVILLRLVFSIIGSELVWWATDVPYLTLPKYKL